MELWCNGDKHNCGQNEIIDESFTLNGRNIIWQMGKGIDNDICPTQLLLHDLPGTFRDSNYRYGIKITPSEVREILASLDRNELLRLVWERFTADEVSDKLKSVVLQFASACDD